MKATGRKLSVQLVFPNMIPESHARRLGRLFARPGPAEPAVEEDTNLMISKEALDEISRLFEQYASEVHRCDLSQSSKAMYVDHANYFVRWVHGDFQPGVRGSNSRSLHPSEPL